MEVANVPSRNNCADSHQPHCYRHWDDDWHSVESGPVGVARRTIWQNRSPMEVIMVIYVDIIRIAILVMVMLIAGMVFGVSLSRSR